MRVFSKEKFIESVGKRTYDSLFKDFYGNNWVDDCDGQPIVKGDKVISKDNVTYGSRHDWEIEIEDKESK